MIGESLLERSLVASLAVGLGGMLASVFMTMLPADFLVPLLGDTVRIWWVPVALVGAIAFVGAAAYLLGPAE